MHEEEDGGEANVCSDPRLVPFKSLDEAEIIEEGGKQEQASRLCGYLSKLSGKGPLRGFKPRWFVYDPRKCYLYYFKTPQDALPLGHIEIGDAYFSYNVEGEEGQFSVCTAEKEFLLKAPSRQVMNYWLQQLQQKRWEFSNARGSGHRDSWSSPTTAFPLTGLVGKDNGRDPRIVHLLLQQTLRTSQCERLPVCSRAPDPNAASEQSQPSALTQEEAAQLEARLQERDEQIPALCGHMERLSLEKESLQQELKALKIKVGEMNDQLGMLMETIQAKDEMIMKLSQESSTPTGNTNGSGSPQPHKDQQELGVLKDSLQGYKSQNKFLNKEILELTVLRRNAESREKAFEAKCTALEARLCQVESKYLVLLQEVKNPVCSTQEQNPASEVISRLLEDALQVESPDQQDHPIFKPNTVSEYDIYGFKTVPEEEEEEERLVAKVRALELKSLSMTDQEVSVGVKWENFLASTMNRDLVRSPELKSLIRCGVPHEHRSKVWRWCVSFHVKKFRDHLAPDYYETLLNVAREKPNPASKQIELDLLRTLPNNKHYASPSAAGIQKLRNVLVAFSWRNPDIGYCQGLNRLAAITLLYLDQEDAFWALVAIVEVFMPRDYYTKTLLGSQVDQRVFKDLMSEKLPRLHAHFEQQMVDFSLITFNWFLVVFVDSVVSDILFKIWDAFLFEGPKIIFRFALALFKYKEEEFLKLHDSTATFKYLRYFTRTILDSRKLMNIAFAGMNPFPMKQIHNRRAFHLEKVRLELTELEAIRQTFLKERETSQDRRSFVSDDEEEN
uniref:TBC1 domain family, member 2B n=1 Tax=Oryzias sinensis TaxID=183150 RepID=A0A8C7ZJ45_9TELE